MSAIGVKWEIDVGTERMENYCGRPWDSRRVAHSGCKYAVDKKRSRSRISVVEKGELRGTYQRDLVTTSLTDK